MINIIDYVSIDDIIYSRVYLISREFYRVCNERFKLRIVNDNFKYYIDIKRTSPQIVEKSPMINLITNPHILPIKLHITGNIMTAQSKGAYHCFFAPRIGYLYVEFGGFYWVLKKGTIITNADRGKFESVEQLVASGLQRVNARISS